MAGQSSAMFGWSWTEVSVLGSQVFTQSLMESCENILRTSTQRGPHCKSSNLDTKCMFMYLLLSIAKLLLNIFLVFKRD